MTESVQCFSMQTPFGVIALSLQDEALCRLDLRGGDRRPNHARLDDRHGVYTALQGYFRDPAHVPQVTLRLAGTAFQKRVWQALRRIPPGETRTYGELAREFGTSARAVGNACRANPVPVVIPCHRVVAVNGLGGFAGDRDGRLVAVKRWLLGHEGIVGQA